MAGTDTARLFAEMTDGSAFERIPAAVLRSSEPSLYGTIAHPGVQPGARPSSSRSTTSDGCVRATAQDSIVGRRPWTTAT